MGKRTSQSTKTLVTYMPDKGRSLANQKSRKLRVFGQKLEGTQAIFIVIWIDIKGNETIPFIWRSFHMI